MSAHAPSQQRIAEARASGHVPRVPLLGLFGLLGLLAVGAGQLAGYREELRALLAAPLSGADPWALLSSLGVRLAWSLALVLAIVLVGSWLAQGPAFVSRREPFAAQGIDRTAALLFGAGALSLLALVTWESRALEVSADYGWALALLSVACLAIDIAFARARWFQSLWMTRRQLRDEQREHGVSPELAAARRQARA